MGIEGSLREGKDTDSMGGGATKVCPESPKILYVGEYFKVWQGGAVEAGGSFVT